MKHMTGELDFFQIISDALTIEDIVYAALLALFLTWMITTISNAFKIVISHPTEFDYNPQDLAKLLQKCYVLFPRDSILFHGQTFKRGMKVRVVTIREKIFEGQLIGSNSDNMLCVLTGKNLIAQELDDISDIIILETTTI